MLKPLLLSGWFRAQPFLKYFVVVILIAPLLAASGNSSSAKSQVVKITSVTGESDSVSKEVAGGEEPNVGEIITTDQINSSREEFDSVPKEIAAVNKPQVLSADKIESLAKENYSKADSSLSSSNLPGSDPLAAVELAPLPDVSVSQQNLVQKLKASKVQSLKRERNSQARVKLANELAAVELAPTQKTSPPIIIETPVTEPRDEAEVEQTDPLGSPHPIPWKWITTTQEAIGSKGASGVRYYRSVPVISPDGKYAVYSRVQLEVKPQMYNSRVTSVLFVQDMQTKKLWVMASTNPVKDPLLNLKTVSSAENDTTGTIGVLVPVSWSKKGDRFLARKFEGIFNTGDSTDHAVIWDRQKNHANTVAPAQAENEHEKIAILLGWSKSEPDHVLFRAGELGEENWPLVKVTNDGKTVNTTTEDDQPIIFGKKVTEIWAGPQVAYR
jgi:hypothetical protein